MIATICGSNDRQDKEIGQDVDHALLYIGRKKPTTAFRNLR
jgi:hypothetical protein